MTDHDQLRAVERFVYHEARLADEHRYAEWEELWTDDAVYWVPAAQMDGPGEHMSIISDNRHRLGTRVKQLESGRRYAQAPPSRLRRVISNIELLGTTDQGDLEVGANFVLVEARERGSHTFAGRVTYRLRPTASGYALSYKLVDLVDREWAQPSIAFLI
ncbi:MAG: aromatic-ring-hydroxylating dioxygenase subunit beta [Acidimicrobiales bacterium]